MHKRRDGPSLHQRLLILLGGREARYRRSRLLLRSARARAKDGCQRIQRSKLRGFGCKFSVGPYDDGDGSTRVRLRRVRADARELDQLLEPLRADRVRILACLIRQRMQHPCSSLLLFHWSSAHSLEQPLNEATERAAVDGDVRIRDARRIRHGRGPPPAGATAPVGAGSGRGVPLSFDTVF